MGQTASAELAELTECVIDPPQHVLKDSEQKEAEMLPERGALRLKETSEMPSNGEEESFLKRLADSMEKIKKNNQRAAEDLCRTDEMLESIRRAREAKRKRVLPGVRLGECRVWSELSRKLHVGENMRGVMLLDHQPQRNQEGYNQQSQRWEKCL